MSEMVVISPPAKKVVLDYEIITTPGMVLTKTIDPSTGDSIEINDDYIKIYISKKAIPNNSSILSPEEHYTIYKPHIVSIQHLVREVLVLTPEQQKEWDKTIQEMGGHIQ